MPTAPVPPLLLVLAWDEDDWSGPPHLAPTLPLLRALAARRPLLAVLPHLPEGASLVPGTDLPAAPPPLPPAPAPVPAGPLPPLLPAVALRPAPAAPALAAGMLLLPPPAPAAAAGAAAGAVSCISRFLGLAEAAPGAFAGPAAGVLAAPAGAGPALGRVQLRPPFRPLGGPGFARVPAAPYLGSSHPADGVGSPTDRIREATDLEESLTDSVGGLTDSVHEPSQQIREASQQIREATDSVRGVTDSIRETTDSVREATDQSSGPVSEFPDDPGDPDGLTDPTTGDETGPAEAADLPNDPAGPAAANAPEALPPTPARASLTQALMALQPPGLTPFALAHNLHYRVIQYARFAAPLVAAQPETFGLIYAADWPTWLAGLELRYRLRCPLVLRLTALVAAEAAPAERGWLLELERYALRRAHLVLVPTEALARQVRALYPGTKAVQVVAADDAAALAAALGRVVG